MAALFVLLALVAVPIARACLSDASETAVIDGEIPGGG